MVNDYRGETMIFLRQSKMMDQGGTTGQNAAFFLRENPENMDLPRQSLGRSNIIVNIPMLLSALFQGRGQPSLKRPKI
ncbi:hypothetical protein HF329_11330 [Chitinophaga oryzae]|uniref:Uncharacterized protein n=1 Tax=Chitinophaga oryzae TaxID=2725414 RepID=A0AAE6ZF89_9BACT|nr:hypothetical protein [Chitinophaga oryzae]QJB31885.1 hypothetical protein HF329_11330 [Chitinophaga oryzae]